MDRGWVCGSNKWEYGRKGEMEWEIQAWFRIIARVEKGITKEIDIVKRQHGEEEELNLIRHMLHSPPGSVKAVCT